MFEWIKNKNIFRNYQKVFFLTKLHPYILYIFWLISVCLGSYFNGLTEGGNISTILSKGDSIFP